MTDSTKPSSFLLLSVLLMLAYLLPYHVYPFNAFYNEWLALLAVPIGIALVAEQKIIVVRLPWLALIPTGLAIIIGFQVLLGLLTYSWDAILPIAYLIVATVAILFGASVGAIPQSAEGLYRAIAWAHLVSGLISAALATLQFFGKEAHFAPLVMLMGHETTLRPYANLGQANHLALLFCLSIASGWWLYQTDKLRSTIAISMGLWLLWGLILTQSRIGWIIIPLFACTIGAWRKHNHFKQIPISYSVAFVMVYISGVFALPWLGSLHGTAIRSVAEHASAGSARWVMLQQALEISLSHPWLGAGWNEFGAQQVLTGADFATTEQASHAHNLLMNFAAELGWPITLVIFTTLGYWFYKCCLSNKQQKALSKEVAFSTLFFIAVLVHSLVEFPLWYAYILIPTSFLLGMVHQEQLGSMGMRFSRGYSLTLILVVIIGMVTIATDYRRVVLGFRALGWENLGLQADEGSTEPQGFTLFPHYYEYFRFAKTTAHENSSFEEVAFREKIAKRFGYPPVLMRMALMYALNDRPADAARMMTTLMKLHKNHYSEAYLGWKYLASAKPEKFAPVFNQLISPAP
jgi:hypothetical protein